MSSESEQQNLIDRREAIRRVSALLGGVAFVGGTGLLTACERARQQPAADTAAAAAANRNIGEFTPQDVAFLDEVADTILPDTKTPGAKAAKTGAFMALMVTDGYKPAQQRAFREGMRKLDAASMTANKVSFVAATPQQRLALLETLDREQKAETEARQKAAERPAEKRANRVAQKAAGAAAAEPGEKSTQAKLAPGKEADAFLPDQRAENATTTEVGAATAVTDPEEPAPPHYFRMMKELALLGYFTSEIGYTKAMRYVEAPGRFDPCAPYKPGDKAWAPHA